MIKIPENRLVDLQSFIGEIFRVQVRDPSRRDSEFSSPALPSLLEAERSVLN